MNNRNGGKLAWMIVLVAFGVLVTVGAVVANHGERIARCETQIEMLREDLVRIGERIARCETKIDMLRESLARIETQLETLIERKEP